jgi:PAS domain S-box-containing protein
METLTQISPDAIFGLDEDGIVDLWNPEAERLFGQTAEEALGKPLPSGIATIDHLRAGSGVSQIAGTTPDGRALNLELRYAVRKSAGWVVLAIDRDSLLEREKQAADRLRYESRFRELLEAAPDAIVEVDRAGAIVLLNRVAETLFGYSRDELLGMHVDALVPEAFRGRHADNRSAYWAKPSTRPMGRNMVLAARRRDGSEFPVEISLSPVRSEDGFRVTAIIRDMTDRREAEDKVRAVNMELENRNREIERADRLKSEFLASMSHELRTPLHTIIGFTELLAEELEGPLNEKQKRFVKHVHADSIHLLELINDVLDLSKIESGRMELELESVDVWKVLGDTLNGIGRAVEIKNIGIDHRIGKGLMVTADRVRLREILINLLTNAVKFTEQGGNIRIESSVDPDGMVRVAIEDTGIGIAPEDQAVIFEKFRQVGSTTRGVREGTGLGLAIVRHLVEMHGGSVSLKSAPGEGSCFSFTLPAAPEVEAAACPLVMIVEDEPAAAELIASYLHPLGLRIEIVVNASFACERAREMQPDAITLDLLMPERSGWRVLRELRESSETSSIPVLVLSVMDRDREALALGAAEYLQKPVKRETLLRALRRHVPAIAGVAAQ